MPEGWSEDKFVPLGYEVTGEWGRSAEHFFAQVLEAKEATLQICRAMPQSSFRRCRSYKCPQLQIPSYKCPQRQIQYPYAFVLLLMLCRSSKMSRRPTTVPS